MVGHEKSFLNVQRDEVKLKSKIELNASGKTTCNARSIRYYIFILTDF